MATTRDIVDDLKDIDVNTSMAHAHDNKSVLDSITSSQVNGFLPTGSVIAMANSTVPSGYLECNGQAIDRTVYEDLFAYLGTTYGNGDGTTTFNIPDLRGEFVRGWDNGRSVDSGRTIGTAQADELKAHTHLYAKATSCYDGVDSTTVNQGDTCFPSAETTQTGGVETRPRNVAMMYVIKY